MAAKVINLTDYRKSKEKEKTQEAIVKSNMRASLDNDSVKRKYKIKTLTAQEQHDRIVERIKRINDLMRELENTTKGDKNDDD